MYRVAFLGSKKVGEACLKFLIEHEESLGAQVVGILSNDRTIDHSSEFSFNTFAKKHDIPFFSNANELENLGTLDWLISVQYHEILKSSHLNLAQKGAINLHMAPLPEYRGCNQFSFAIIDGVEEFGTTLHVMTLGIDDGAILAEKRWPISNTCTIGELYNQTEQASIDLFQQEIKSILQGDKEPIPQNKFTDRKKSFHLRNEIDDLKQIDPAWDDEKIDRHFRATYFPPFPPPYFMKNGEKVPLTENWRKLR